MKKLKDKNLHDFLSEHRETGKIVCAKLEHLHRCGFISVTQAKKIGLKIKNRKQYTVFGQLLRIGSHSMRKMMFVLLRNNSKEHRLEKNCNQI